MGVFVDYSMTSGSKGVLTVEAVISLRSTHRRDFGHVIHEGNSFESV